MASESKQIRQAGKVLHRLQQKQVKSVLRIGRLRGKLEKASRKMQKIEMKIARLEKRVDGLRNPGSQPIVGAHFALIWPVEAVRTVPSLTDVQTLLNSEQDISANGAEHKSPEPSLQQSEAFMAGAR